MIQEIIKIQDSIQQAKCNVQIEFVRREDYEYQTAIKSLRNNESTAIKLCTISSIDSIELDGVLIKIKDFIEIQGKDEQIYVCKLLSISYTDKECLSTDKINARIQWCFNKYQIDSYFLKLSKTQLESLGEKELFITNIFQSIKVSSILNKCDVIEFNEYKLLTDPIPDVQSNLYLSICLVFIVYYTRAHYNAYERTLIPPFESWPTICICMIPENAEEQYVVCNKCKIRFHYKCIDEMDMYSLSSFRCINCNLLT